MIIFNQVDECEGEGHMDRRFGICTYGMFCMNYFPKRLPLSLNHLKLNDL